MKQAFFLCRQIFLRINIRELFRQCFPKGLTGLLRGKLYFFIIYHSQVSITSRLSSSRREITPQGGTGIRQGLQRKQSQQDMFISQRAAQSSKDLCNECLLQPARSAAAIIQAAITADF